MVVNLTWHSFMEQVWGIRLRCLTNCTCCETSELELFSHTVGLARWFVRAPEEALHKKTLYSAHEDILTTGRHNDERQLRRRKKEYSGFCARGDKRAVAKSPQSLNSLLSQHLPSLQRSHVLLAKTSAYWRTTRNFGSNGSRWRRCRSWDSRNTFCSIKK